jgi:hypothetical protein
VLLAFTSLVVWAYLVRDPQRLRLTESLEPGGTYSRTISDIGTSGDRFTVVVRPEGDLRVGVRISRIARSYLLSADEQGAHHFEGVLVGDDWKIRVHAIDGTSGSFDLEVESSASRTIRHGDSVTGSLPVATRSVGYALNVPAPGPLRIAVRPIDNGFHPSLEVLTLRNEVAMYSRPTSEGWEVFEDATPARYVIVIHAPDRPTGGYRLTVDSGVDQPSDPVDVTRPPQPSGAIPNVYNLDYPDAERALAAAGFTAIAVDVCSSSVAAGYVRQVYIPRGAAETVLVDAPGAATVAPPAGTAEVHVKVADGETCS